MKTVVIGGAGFIGSHLCDSLLEQGHTVACMDNFSLGTEENIRHLSQHTGFHLYKGDAADRKTLEVIFERERPDYVFHLAANSDIQASAADPDVEFQNTYSTTFQILDCMRRFGVKKLFFASTSAIYGDKRDILLREDTPELAPVSYYGAAKLGSEALISAFSHMNGIQALVFRFPNVIGPRLTHGVIFDFIHKLQQNPVYLQILGDGNQTKPYIYVTDLVGAILQFMDMNQTGVSLYNVGVEGETSVAQIADFVCDEMKLTDVQYDFTGGEGGWRGDVPRFQYCLDKIHRAGWRAVYTSDEAVRKTIRSNISRR